MSDSPATRIRRRTVVGGSLGVAVAGLLWISRGEGGAARVLVIASALALWGLVEARRMGTLADGRQLGAAAVAVVACGLGLWGATAEGSRLEVAGLGPGLRHWAALGIGTGLGLAAGILGALPGLAARGGPRWVSGLAPLLGRVAWLALPLPCLYLVRRSLGVEGLAALLLLSKVGDAAAYYAGNALGRRFPRRPFPRVSPNKTAVGCWASLVTATLVGALVQWWGWLPPARLGWGTGALAGALVNLAAQAGDLLESAAKRAAGVGDSGTAFGPSGGVLDLLDSVLLAVPAALLTWPLLVEWPT